MKKIYYYVIGVILVLVIGTIILVLNNKVESDNVRFANEYKSVPRDNVFVYKDIDEIIKIMEHGTGIVYLGFPECPWCRAYVNYLNEVAVEEGIDEIYYFNILEDRKNNTKEYQKIVSILGDNLQYDEEGNYRIYVPNVSFHIKGEVIGNDYETSYDTMGYDNPEEYWSDDKVSDLKIRLRQYCEKIFISLNTCSECNK